MSCMFVPNFEAIDRVTLISKPENSQKFGVRSSLSQKRLKYGKKYFMGLCALKYRFIPTNPLLATMRFFLFFFPFLNLMHSSSPKPRNSEIYFYVKLLGCKRNFVSQKFLGRLPQELPQNWPQKINFLNGSS